MLDDVSVNSGDRRLSADSTLGDDGSQEGNAFLTILDITVQPKALAQQAFVPSNLSQTSGNALGGVPPAAGDKDTPITDSVQAENKALYYP